MKNKKTDWEAKVMMMVVYVLLFLGTLGVLLLDVVWKKGVYLIVILLMMDILYKRAYDKKKCKIK